MMWWDILEIEYTTDLNKIKKAYLNLIKDHHYEDDPITYEKIKNAYEVGAKNARRTSKHEAYDSKKTIDEEQEDNFKKTEILIEDILLDVDDFEEKEVNEIEETEEIVVDFDIYNNRVEAKEIISNFERNKFKKVNWTNKSSNDEYLDYLMLRVAGNYINDSQSWRELIAYLNYHISLGNMLAYKVFLEFLSLDNLKRIDYKIKISIIRRFLDHDIFLQYPNLDHNLVKETTDCITRLDESNTLKYQFGLKGIRNFFWNVKYSTNPDIYSSDSYLYKILNYVGLTLKYILYVLGAILIIEFCLTPNSFNKLFRIYIIIIAVIMFVFVTKYIKELFFSKNGR